MKKLFVNKLSANRYATSTFRGGKKQLFKGVKSVDSYIKSIKPKSIEYDSGDMRKNAKTYKTSY